MTKSAKIGLSYDMIIWLFLLLFLNFFLKLFLLFKIFHTTYLYIKEKKKCNFGHPKGFCKNFGCLVIKRKANWEWLDNIKGLKNSQNYGF